MDLSKAFDNIHHHILLQKLAIFGIWNNSLDWLKSYLSERQQQVKVNHIISDPQSITSRVPQGSILGPVWFLLYINDIFYLSNSTNLDLILYADDATCLVTGKNVDDAIDATREFMSKALLWLQANRLKLNAAKTKFSIFSKCRTDNDTSDISASAFTISRANSFKLLGVIVDEHLNWKHQIRKVTNSLSCAISVIHKLRPLVNKKGALSLYNTFFLPHSNYCASIWTACGGTKLNAINILQHKALKIISKLPHRTPSCKLYLSVNVHKIEDVRTLQNLVFTYKTIHHLLPNHFFNHLTHSVSQRLTRSNDTFYPPLVC